MFKNLFKKNNPSATGGGFVRARGVQSSGSAPVERRKERVDRRVSQQAYTGEERRVSKSGRGLRAADGKADIQEVIVATEVLHVVDTRFATGTDGGRRGPAAGREAASKTPIMQLVPEPSVRSVGREEKVPLGKAHPIFVGSESELKAVLKDPLEGILQAVVAQALSGECVALYLGCAQVALVMTKPFEESLHFTAVCKTIEEEWMYQIRHVLHAPSALVVTVRDQCNLKLDRDPDFGLNHERRLKRLYVDIIEACFRMNATDIHLTTRDDVGQIMFRLDGKPRRWLTFKKQLMLDMLAAGFGHYLTAGTTNTEQFKANESQAFMTHHTIAVERDGKTEYKQVECRYNHKPHLIGLASVIRLLESSLDLQEIKTLRQLGYAESHVDALDLAMSRQWGLVLFVGSTGQGKSTTLRSLYSHMPDAETTVVYTSESPAEYRYKYAIQFSVPIKTDETPENKALSQVALIMDFLRMDPDRGMIGEIRDPSTAKIAVEFTQTGHPAASTIHGDGVIDALSRLTGDSMRVPAQDLASAKLLNTVVYQRLVPLLCAGCKISATDPKSGLSLHKKNLISNKFKLDPATMFVANENGCEACRPKGIGLRGNGIKGQTLAAETFTPNAKAKALIAVRDWVGLEGYWRSQRVSKFNSADMTGKTAYEHALYLASIGLISPLSIESNFEALELYEIQRVAADGEPT